MPDNPLEAEFEWYLDHQDELIKKYDGKVLVIKDQTIIGVYESEEEAITETSKKESLGTFLIQRCTPGDEAYTATFHSRAAFV